MKQKLSVAPTLKNYDKKNLPKDILAGIIIMAVSIPISMGYAQISGLPAVYGLYGSVFPIILFALFSTSPQFIFGVDAAPAALVGAAVLGMGIEAGSKVFLLDEDTSATNFMVRDAFMQHVISREKEPITPFLERARDLYEKEEISTILVAGSSGAFFHIADTVIQMDNYMPVDITAKVRELCRDYPLNENTAAGFKAPQSHRIMSKNTPLNGSKKDYYGHFKVQDKPERLKVKVHGRDGFSIGKQEVDLRYVEQLIDSEQTGALGALLKYAVEKLIDGKRTLPEIVELLCNKLEKEGLSFLSEGYTSCGYAVPRRQEIYACFNRYRRP